MEAWSNPCPREPPKVWGAVNTPWVVHLAATLVNNFLRGAVADPGSIPGASTESNSRKGMLAAPTGSEGHKWLGEDSLFVRVPRGHSLLAPLEIVECSPGRFPVSSNGRTRDFGSRYGGSNPSTGTAPGRALALPGWYRPAPIRNGEVSVRFDS